MMTTDKALTEEEIAKMCELYIRDRYAQLSEAAKELVHDTSMYDYTRMAWERDFYRAQLINHLAQETTQ